MIMWHVVINVILFIFALFFLYTYLQKFIGEQIKW